MKFSFNNSGLHPSNILSDNFQNNSGNVNIVESFTTNFQEVIPPNTFEYKVADAIYSKDDTKFHDTKFNTKYFNNVYELTNIPVDIRMEKSENMLGNIQIKFKAEEVIFKSKLTSEKNEEDTVVYLSKMLPEDTHVQEPEVYKTSVRDNIPEDLKIPFTMVKKPKEPEFKFYTDKYFKKIYVKVLSNRGVYSDGWLSLDDNNKFIVVEEIDKIFDFKDYIPFILPKMYPFKLDKNTVMPMITNLDTTMLTFTPDYIAKNPMNMNLGQMKLGLLDYNSDTLSGSVANNKSDPYSMNMDIYELFLEGSEGSYVKLCLLNPIKGNIYVTESSADNTMVSIKCKLFREISTNGVYIYVLLKESGLDSSTFDTFTKSHTKNYTWLGIGDDGKLQLMNNIFSGININEFIKIKEKDADVVNVSQDNTGGEIVSEGFTNNNDAEGNDEGNTPSGVNFMYYPEHTATATPEKDDNVYQTSAENCAKYCYNRDPSYVGAYFNKNKKGGEINCDCYSKIVMTSGGDKNDETILFGNAITNHHNISNVTRTITTKNSEECSINCLVDKNGYYTEGVKGYTFDKDEEKDNCKCHTDMNISYMPLTGGTKDEVKNKVTGATHTVLDEDNEIDYEPLTKYFETSRLFGFLRNPGVRTLLIIGKITTAVIALILYSYFSHEDLPTFRFLKGMLVIVFSEIYLIYGFIKVVLMDYRKRHFEV